MHGSSAISVDDSQFYTHVKLEVDSDTKYPPHDTGKHRKKRKKRKKKDNDGDESRNVSVLQEIIYEKGKKRRRQEKATETEKDPETSQDLIMKRKKEHKWNVVPEMQCACDSPSTVMDSLPSAASTKYPTHDAGKHKKKKKKKKKKDNDGDESRNVSVIGESIDQKGEKRRRQEKATETEKDPEPSQDFVIKRERELQHNWNDVPEMQYTCDSTSTVMDSLHSAADTIYPTNDTGKHKKKKKKKKKKDNDGDESRNVSVIQEIIDQKRKKRRHQEKDTQTEKDIEASQDFVKNNWNDVPGMQYTCYVPTTVMDSLHSASQSRANEKDCSKAAVCNSSQGLTGVKKHKKKKKVETSSDTIFNGHNLMRLNVVKNKNSSPQSVLHTEHCPTVQEEQPDTSKKQKYKRNKKVQGSSLTEILDSSAVILNYGIGENGADSADMLNPEGEICEMPTKGKKLKRKNHLPSNSDLDNCARPSLNIREQNDTSVFVQLDSEHNCRGESVKDGKKKKEKQGIKAIDDSEESGGHNYPEGLYPVHIVGSRAHAANKVVEDELRAKGVEVLRGKWNKREESILRRNVLRFAKDFDIEDPSDLFTLLHKSEDKKIELRRIMKQNDFNHRLVDGINRSIFCCYSKARKLFHGLNMGPFSDEEVKQLQKLQYEYGNKWVKIGMLMGRSPENVHTKWKQLRERSEKEVIKSGKWTKEEIRNLRHGVVYLTGCKDLASLSSQLPWGEIAHFVPTRTASQCRNQWLNHDCSTDFPADNAMHQFEKKHATSLVNW
ncbi:uncharacterized protein LOC106163410 isoform X2 [Lingula anatina]|uniref:Uncharacterized protein LOC106163410 isoform X2 n=1 Tax=Lingula anatina TaxID=7574 RepID=A0A2R2MTX3_LINAN|nr:uncharacterized protein LOC106163410 isoform X2 [Lingula anatina]|eukprot:XP_023933578.1 uncharacterized protein LOC106163410 isoform X2 [Lingula anatina]